MALPLAVRQGQSTSAQKGRARLPSSLDSHGAGWNVGVAIAIGNGASFGITAGGNGGDGNGEGEATNWRDTQVGCATSQTHLQSGGLTTLRGAQVQGQGIALNAAALQIESLQDTSRYPDALLLGGGLMGGGVAAAKATGSLGLKFKVVGATVGGGANLSAQKWFNGDQPVDWLSVGLSSVTGWHGASTANLVPLLQLNTGAALVNSAVHGQDPGATVVGAMGGTVLGWGLGSLTSSWITRLGNARPSTVNANYTKNWQPYGNEVFRYVPPSELAAPYLGIIVGSGSTEYLGTKVQSDLHGNEK